MGVPLKHRRRGHIRLKDHEEFLIKERLLPLVVVGLILLIEENVLMTTISNGDWKATTKTKTLKWMTLLMTAQKKAMITQNTSKKFSITIVLVIEIELKATKKRSWSPALPNK